MRQRNVVDGKRRLRVAVICPANGATGTGSVGDAPAPDLQTLLNGIISPSERIKISGKMIAGWQQYIREQYRKIAPFRALLIS
ncbi:lysis system i-spanin subunit Rz [Kosakonia radicincitans]|uniref:lysis system i-spanin subunit Rz n=1 Tax=Kosakonia radicincitans TaxID=283686 RepID=UPI003CD0A4E1